ncbi:MAG: glycosyltransferase family 4 protein [Terrimicrobiaceae bacterium]|nr:glycosyltransferase family 4 protein [Terrimicrobiaceae bacterium]
MRIGIFLPRRWRRFSLNMEELGESLRQLGHEPILICRGADEENCRISLQVAAEADEATPAFWRALDLHAVIAFANMGAAAAVRAMRSVGIFVVSRGDTDGQMGVRVYPYAAWLRMVDPARGPIDFLKRFRHLLNCWMFLHRQLDEPVLEGIGEADVVVVETTRARQNLSRFLQFHRHPEWISKLHVVPHPVAPTFEVGEPSPDPGPVILCVGRWEDDQKNTPLMARTLKRVMNARPDVSVRISGSSAGVFSGLRGVRILGCIPNDEMPGIFDGSRCILSSSRYEGHPISGLEAVCRGRTVVAPPLPGFQDIAKDGRFGSISESHSSRALSAAVLTEFQAWENGLRDPEAIADFWRPRVSHATVARSLIALISS